MKQMEAQLKMAEQEIQDLKQRSVTDRERMAKSDAEIQDLKKRQETMAEEMKSLKDELKKN